MKEQNGTQDKQLSKFQTFDRDLTAPFEHITVFQPNSGHIAATNAGFERSSGDLITFLDADDFLFLSMCSKDVDLFDDNVAKVHYKLMEVDKDGNHLKPRPAEDVILSEGEDAYLEIFEGRFVTSLGNIYKKKLIEELFPLPKLKTMNNDKYLSTVTPEKLRVSFFWWC